MKIEHDSPLAISSLQPETYCSSPMHYLGDAVISMAACFFAFLFFFFFFVFSLALLDFVSRATVVVQASVVRQSVVRKLRFCRKPLHGSRPNFVGRTLSTISPENFLSVLFFSKCSIFKFLRFYFVLFSLTWDPRGANISKRPSSYIFYSILTKLYNK